MFREMRRKKQQLSEVETAEILKRGTSGTLALFGDGGYPYAVPISYVFANGKIYFHGGKQGHKLDAVSRNPKASFCVIEQDLVVPEKYTTYFRSAIVFGTIRILETEAEKTAAAEKIALKYAPEGTAAGQLIAKEMPALCVLELTIEHISGKQAIELISKPPLRHPTAQ